MGIPSVRREVHSYLTDTLHSLISELSPQEKEDSVIVVLIAEASGGAGAGAGTHSQGDTWHPVTEGEMGPAASPGESYQFPVIHKFIKIKSSDILAPPRGDAVYLLAPPPGTYPKGFF